MGVPSKSTSAETLHRSMRGLADRLGTAVSRPLHLLGCRPVVQVLGLSTGFIFGTYTLMLSTFASLFQTHYGQSSTTSSLHYIFIALGAFICAQAGGPLMDLIWRRMSAARPERVPTPEYRVPYLLVGLIPGVIGLFWYAWAAKRTLHWAIIDAGACIFVCGSFMFSQGLFAYLLDEFPSSHSASANAATRLGTNVFGFAFPIFAPDTYKTLRYGWGNSLLGFVFAALGALTVAVL